VAMKKSDAWSISLDLNLQDQCKPIIASLSCEDVDARMQGNMVHIKVFGKSSSDLRARFNSTLRSVRAVSEALMSIDQQENAEV